MKKKTPHKFGIRNSKKIGENRVNRYLQTATRIWNLKKHNTISIILGSSDEEILRINKNANGLYGVPHKTAVGAEVMWGSLYAFVSSFTRIPLLSEQQGNRDGHLHPSSHSSKPVSGEFRQGWSQEPTAPAGSPMQTGTQRAGNVLF